MFLGLLGVDTPPGPEDSFQVINGVGVKGLSSRDGGAGSLAVRRNVEVAACESNMGRRIYGFVDGDGVATAGEGALATGDMGPLFRWNAYSIENLLARPGFWPADWGEEPDWREELKGYAPYVASNHLQRIVNRELTKVGLDKYSNPGLSVGQALTAENVSERLKDATFTLCAGHVREWFESEIAIFLRSLSEGSLVSAHGVMNGKWLVQHLVPRRVKISEEACRRLWAMAAGKSGGLADLKELWTRLWG